MIMFKKRTLGIIAATSVIIVSLSGCAIYPEPEMVNGKRVNPIYNEIIDYTIELQDGRLVDCFTYDSNSMETVCDWDHVSKNTEPTNDEDLKTINFVTFVHPLGEKLIDCVSVRNDDRGSGMDCDD
jgi:hypothetical protein